MTGISTTTLPAARALRAGRPTPSGTSGQAIDMWEGCREMANGDSDFDPIRDEPAFQDMVGREAGA